MNDSFKFGCQYKIEFYIMRSDDKGSWFLQVITMKVSREYVE